MASVPGPDPDKPLPRPGAPAQEPEHDEERWEAAPEEAPLWLPEPWDPAREYEEQGEPAATPL
jgi:hypothetical protein